MSKHFAPDGRTALGPIGRRPEISIRHSVIRSFAIVLLLSLCPCAATIAAEQRIALPGTETFVNLSEDLNAESVAQQTTSKVGAPVFVVRQLDATRAVLGIDQLRLFDLLEERLRQSGANVQRVDGLGPHVFGREPPPRLMVSFTLTTGGERAKKIARTLARARLKTDHAEQLNRFALVTQMIRELTRLPINVYPTDQDGSLTIVPSTATLTDELVRKLTMVTGESPEPLQRVSPL